MCVCVSASCCNLLLHGLGAVQSPSTLTSPSCLCHICFQAAADDRWEGVGDELVLKCVFFFACLPNGWQMVLNLPLQRCWSPGASGGPVVDLKSPPPLCEKTAKETPPPPVITLLQWLTGRYDNDGSLRAQNVQPIIECCRLEADRGGLQTPKVLKTLFPKTKIQDTDFYCPTHNIADGWTIQQVVGQCSQ